MKVNKNGIDLMHTFEGDPNDPSIINEFLKWNKAGGKVLNGLVRRREAESKLYGKV